MGASVAEFAEDGSDLRFSGATCLAAAEVIDGLAPGPHGKRPVRFLAEQRADMGTETLRGPEVAAEEALPRHAPGFDALPPHRPRGPAERHRHLGHRQPSFVAEVQEEPKAGTQFCDGRGHRCSVGNRERSVGCRLAGGKRPLGQGGKVTTRALPLALAGHVDSRAYDAAHHPPFDRRRVGQLVDPEQRTRQALGHGIIGIGFVAEGEGGAPGAGMRPAVELAGGVGVAGAGREGEFRRGS